MNFHSEVFGRPFIGRGIVVVMKHLRIQVAENAVGGVGTGSAKFFVKDGKILREDDTADAGAAGGGLKIVVVGGVKMLRLVLPEKHRTPSHLLRTGWHNRRH